MNEVSEATQLMVDPRSKRIVLVVHGVQVGMDSALNHDELVRQLIAARLSGAGIDHDVVMYRYENINDVALAKLRTTMGAIARGIRIPSG